MDFFEVDKGTSYIHMVYNGTSCGLNDTLWAPNFWLPMPVVAARVLGYMVDIDLGEMFLNFPLPSLLQQFSGVDLCHHANAMDETMSQAVAKGNHCMYWTRCWMGLKPSLFMAVHFYYLAEEFMQGNWCHKKNPLRWDRLG
jgi:hypothetical protein